MQIVNTYVYKTQAINSSLVLRWLLSMYDLVTDKSDLVSITSLNKHS